MKLIKFLDTMHVSSSDIYSLLLEKVFLLWKCSFFARKLLTTSNCSSILIPSIALASSFGVGTGSGMTGYEIPATSTLPINSRTGTPKQAFMSPMITHPLLHSFLLTFFLNFTYLCIIKMPRIRWRYITRDKQYT